MFVSYGELLLALLKQLSLSFGIYAHDDMQCGKLNVMVSGRQFWSTCAIMSGRKQSLTCSNCPLVLGKGIIFKPCE